MADEAWLGHVRQDPRPWLLEEADPAVRAAALQRLLDHGPDSPQVERARTAAMRVDPIRSILEAQDSAGWWVKPGPGYSPKYRGTVWSLIFLDQLGADPSHAGIVRACDYVLGMTQTSSGGFGASGAAKERPAPPSMALHCLHGNLLRAMIGFGRLDDDRVRHAVDWTARSVTGQGLDRWYASGTSGPGFACAVNDGRPCAWGAVKQLGALARIPAGSRNDLVREAIEDGVGFLFSRDPAVADYPMPATDTTPSSSWFKPGFPLGYIADVLQTTEVLAELGHARDERLANALAWVESRQDGDGRWRNRHAYNRKTWVDIERQGAPSKWVTLRACSVLRAAYGD